MEKVYEGKKAPAFTLPNEKDEKVALKDILASGENVVLFFYPKDLTTGCTVEANGFSALKKKFSSAKTVVLGVSKDSVKQHVKFIDKENLSISLLSDESFKVLEKYNVWKEKSMYGRKYMGIMRETFLIGTDGRVLKHWQKVKPAGHAQEVLDCLKEIKTK